MKRFALPLLAVAAAMPAVAQVPVQPTVQVSADMPVVTIQVSERVERAPDIAQVGAGVTSLAPTASAALAETARRMNVVIARARAAGIADRDIQTSGISVEPSYSYPARGPLGDVPPRIVGYRASNNVQLRVRDLPGLGALLDALVASGANNVNGPNFTVEQPSNGLAGARDRAMAEADRQAADYARRAGARRARLLAVTEGVVNMGRPYDMQVFAVSESRAVQQMATPVSPGQVTSAVNLAVTYVLER
jgi:uncharacterized protein YggE